jgi:hypothetical protein
MRRTKLVLAAAALMVAMLVAFSAPAMADNGDHKDFDRFNHKDFNRFNHKDFDFDRKDFDFDDRHFFVNKFDDDCEWEFEEGWFFGPWGWQWGWWFLDC